MHRQQLNFTPLNESNFQVNQRPITITADPQNKVIGETDPALTYHITYGSLVNGNTITGALVRVSGETIGDYEIRT